jgi:hypothetical protein
MANDFLGSIAQLFITYATNYVVSTVPGDNYYNVLLFMGHGEAAANLSTVPAIGATALIRASTLSSMAIGPLLGYLTEFFTENTSTGVEVVIYDDALVTAGTFPAGAVTALTTQFNLYKAHGYFKMMTLHDNIVANVALATLCDTDVLLSKCWIDANDAQMLVGGSTTSMYGVAHTASVAPVMLYHPDATKSPCLTQIGKSLGVLNESGTPVGNSLDFLASSVMTPSGTAGAPLGSTDRATLEGHHVGYYLPVGDGTGRTACYGGSDIEGNLAAALWITAYIEYVSAVKTATYLTQLNMFKNNETYQGILQILKVILSLFAANGRLSNVVITAPPFANLPAAVGDMITIPNAWSATYNDNLRSVTVQGTLYISAS